MVAVLVIPTTQKGSTTGTAYTTEYNYDVFGNLKSIKDPSGGITTMKYDVVNRLKERTLPNGVKTSYEYDDLDRVTSIVHRNAQGQVLTSVTYERKGIGEPSKITREDGSYTKLEYDESLRVKKESSYNAANVLLKETNYSYDASGKRLVQSSVDNTRTFNYGAGYQLDTVVETGETENYDYDQNGRLTLIARDGKTLDLEHDAYDRLTTVENETTGETTQYIYDGNGNRIKAIEGNQQRQFLVAPAMGGGLESTDLITDGSGNLISNYIYGGGSSPFMRLDANGNAVYYLTDAMGTVIGLADGSGASAGKFLYDAFGNILNGSSLDAAAGGDFRFQGQWLESDSGLYNFRARDYDPATGLFLSRDAVDIIDMEPESFNPYQFVYNNPYIYSDPTGMFTITELNSAMNLQKWLITYTQQSARDFLKQKLGEVVANSFNGLINRLLPGSQLGEIFNVKVDNGIVGTGTKFENYLRGQICGIFNSIGSPIIDSLWIEPTINTDNGIPNGNGLNCSEQIGKKGQQKGDVATTGRRSKPDFIIKRGQPKDYRISNTDAYLVGDIKITLGRAVKDYILGSGRQVDQWNAMAKYAGKYQISRAVTYIGFKKLGKTYTNEAGYNADLLKAQRKAIKSNVILFLVSIFD
jgi:RHS repeat-associated protein